MIQSRIVHRALVALLLLTPPLLLVNPAHAQDRESSLSDSEIEKLRDSAYVPNDRVMVFITFLNDRSEAVQKLSTGPRKPGREEDLHNLFEQFTSVIDELNDNLDDYGPKHRDLRKALPKLLQACDRWATVLRTPPDNDTYNVARKLALEAVRDAREETKTLIDEQKTWFTAHPPNKEDEKSKGAPRSE